MYRKPLPSRKARVTVALYSLSELSTSTLRDLSMISLTMINVGMEEAVEEMVEVVVSVCPKDVFITIHCQSVKMQITIISH